MPNTTQNSVVSFGVSKEAALYFDRVFPDDLFVSGLEHVGAITGAKEFVAPLRGPEAAAVAASLLPHAENAEEVVETYALTVAADLLLQMQWLQLPDFDANDTLQRVLMSLNRRLSLAIDVPKATSKRDGALLKKLASARQKILRGAGFANAPGWISEAFLDAATSSGGHQADNFAITMRGLHLVDPTKLSWEQICEFRKDEESKKALRELRLFFNESYEGKDPSYVADKLLSLEDRHNHTARLWKFETIHKSLSVAFTNQSVLMASAGALSAVLAGAPLAATAAAGTIVPIGKVGLEFSKALIESSKAKTENPVKYLTHLRKLASDT